jgi:histidyl-tRNA synthetase
VPLFARSKLTASRSVPSAVLVALPDDASRPASDAVATTLRARGIATEVAPSAVKYGRQIRYADRRGIPFVWFPATGDTGHEVKDIRSGAQAAADPSTWQPPAADLRPDVLTTAIAAEQEQS